MSVAFQAGGVAVDRVVGLDLPGKNDVLLLRGHLEGVVGMPPAKHARQDFNEAGVGLHEVVVDQPSTMHAHLHQHCMYCWPPITVKLHCQDRWQHSQPQTILLDIQFTVCTGLHSLFRPRTQLRAKEPAVLQGDCMRCRSRGYRGRSPTLVTYSGQGGSHKACVFVSNRQVQ